MILLADREGLDQTAQMCRLIWAFLSEEMFSHGMAQLSNPTNIRKESNLQMDTLLLTILIAQKI